MSNNVLQVDTKGHCLLCLNPSQPNSNYLTSVAGFEKLLRYLEVNPSQLYNALRFLQSVSTNEDIPQSIGEAADVKVILCHACSLVIEKFHEVYQRYEAIRLEVDNCLQSVHQFIKNADDSPVRVREYENRMKTEQLGELLNANFAANLRSETLKKCVFKLQNTSGVAPSNAGASANMPSTSSSNMFSTSSANVNMPSTSSASVNMPSTSSASVNVTQAPDERGEIEVIDLENIPPTASPESPPGGESSSARFPCNFCSTRFPSNSLLEHHMDNNPCPQYKRTLVECDLCGDRFISISQLTHHKSRDKLNKDKNKCNFCGKEFACCKSIKDHLRAEHFIPMVMREIPGSTEVALTLLVDNIIADYRQGQEDNRYRCGRCEEEAETFDELKKHLFGAHFTDLVEQIKRC